VLNAVFCVEWLSTWSCCNKMCYESITESSFNWKSFDRNWAAENTETWAHCWTEGLSGQLIHKVFISCRSVILAHHTVHMALF